MKLIASDKSALDSQVWPIYRALVGIASLCAVLIVTAYYVTRPVIAAKRTAQLEHAIFKVLPGAVTKSVFYLAANGKLTREAPNALTTTGDTISLYAGYDVEKRLVGLAIPANGMGYQDAIHLLYGYSPASQLIIGMQVLESKETPGLGDRIEKDQQFLGNFTALDVSVDIVVEPQGAHQQIATRLSNSIVAVKHASKTEPWQIDSITGATISSKAIATIIEQSASAWIPLIWQHRENFQTANELASDKNSAAQLQ